MVKTLVEITSELVSWGLKNKKNMSRKQLRVYMKAATDLQKLNLELIKSGKAA